MGKLGEIATSDKNPLPAKLAPRFEIRRITDKERHGLWARAIFAHSNCYHAPLFKDQCPAAVTGARFKNFIESATYYIDHMVDSGLCFGVYDTQYAFKTSEAKEAGGIYHFYGSNLPKDADSATALAQMDFPLVAIVMSNDEFVPHDGRAAAMGEPDCLPDYVHILAAFARNDHRDLKGPSPWVPTAKGQILFRNATSTRADYQGLGIMKALSHWLMREADLQGFRGIRIDAYHEAVAHVWANPPDPYESWMVCKVSSKNEVKKLPDGTVEKVWDGIDTTFARFFVFLNKEDAKAKPTAQ